MNDKNTENKLMIQPKEFTYPILFSTCVGSHIWGMNKPTSDIDISSVFIYSSEEILLGKRITNTSRKYDNIDEQLLEIGHLIKLLKQSNINAIWGVFSPITITDPYGFLSRLRDIVKTNLSQKIFDSLHGLAYGNYKRYIESPSDSLDITEYDKKLMMIGRTLHFGIQLFKTGEIPNFEPFDPKDERGLLWLFNKLDEEYRNTTLPTEPQHLELFDEFLLQRRMENLLLHAFRREKGGLK